jgi:hypothetical protein
MTAPKSPTNPVEGGRDDLPAHREQRLVETAHTPRAAERIGISGERIR